jgi:hypothetical protein
MRPNPNAAGQTASRAAPGRWPFRGITDSMGRMVPLVLILMGQRSSPGVQNEGQP